MSLPFRDCWNVAGERKEQRLGEYLPPSGITETLGIHLAHVAHANDADGEALHVQRDLRRRLGTGSHLGWSV